MGEERGLGQEKVPFERSEAGYQLLVFEEQLEECLVSVCVGVFEEFVKSAFIKSDLRTM